jgi:cytochrome P450
MLDKSPSREPSYEKMVKELGAMAYVGGADTSVSVVTTFYHAMLNNPVAQARAQAELDKVVGDDRMPNFGDRKNLPYLEAVLAEVLRWIPAFPLGIPHATSEDDEYRGWLIPKGTIVMHNSWCVNLPRSIDHKR